MQKLLAQAVAGLQQTPNHKGQRVPMPETRHKKHRKHAHLGGQAGQPAPGHAGHIRPRQRHEQIILQPRRKANVPPAPEPGKIRGKKRRLEVFRQLQAQKQTHGPRDLGVAGEVEIQLERVKHGGQHQHRPAVAAVIREHLVHQQPQHVADSHQLKQAQRHEPQRAHSAVGVKAVLLLKLRQQRPGAADRPLSDGGKKVQKQRTIDEICLDLAVAPRSVDQVGNGRKAVKADAQRHGHGLPAALAGERAVIFEKGQNRQQPDNAPAQERSLVGAAAGRHAAPAQVGEHRNRDRHAQHRRHGQRVENPAGRQQKRALPALRQVQVHRGHDQQKTEKSKTLQAHGHTSPL